ncbi:Shedu immune nuclease family protein [Vibrio kanaloae]|uniref:Shedu immune nuclease family protein n=1 Tax=Vibrio kanaloae TaxID=170673 RepID=UPI0011B42ECD|nr:Shedu immune nuclease family protein [Vibrio kanaloae]
MPPLKVKRQVLSLSASKCSYPNCEQNLLVDGKFIGHIAFIESRNPYHPRYKEDLSIDESTEENLILLCPNHHAIVDKKPDFYTSEWLRQSKKEHIERLNNIFSSSSNSAPIQDGEYSVHRAISIWNENKNNASEEFWQDLIQKCPVILSLIFPRSTFIYGSKCYIGGKNVGNTQGNLVDFIYTNSITNNVILVEIKTPNTKLLGSKYRNGSYSISKDFSGGIIQVLNYREQLLKNYYALNSESDDSFSVFSPKCLLLAGSFDGEFSNDIQMKSFELFRNNISNVEVITFDELFKKAQDVLDALVCA